MLSSISGILCKDTKRNWIAGSSSYCKSIRKYMKRGRMSSGYEQEQYADDSSSGLSNNNNDNNKFRRIFKKYKMRRPTPDFSQVIDIRDDDNCRLHGLVTTQTAGGDADSQRMAHQLGFESIDTWKVRTFKERDGLYLIPAVLKKDRSPEWLRRCFDYAKPPNTTNLTAHGIEHDGDYLELEPKRLRWTTLGIDYNWETKEYPEHGRQLPSELAQAGNLISRVLQLPEMHPDAAIVNYYPPKSTLSPHVDRSERTNQPLVSISLGQNAVYLTGGTSLEEEPLPLWLRNGDVLVMYGEQRLVYHAIPCIATPTDDKLRFDDVCGGRVCDYLNTSRINITIRQVNEK